MPSVCATPATARCLSALLATTALGCITPVGTEESPIGEVERDCLIPTPAGVAALLAPISLEYPDHSLFVWESLPLTDGTLAEAPHAAVASADALCDAGPTLAADGADRPLSLLSLTEAERAENASRTDGRRLVLVPRGGFVHAGAGYLFYDHVLRGPGVFDEENLATGLCVLPSGAAACERVGLPDGTRLFDPKARVLNRGGLVAEGRALVYGCRGVATFESVCTVTGAPLDALIDAGAYLVHEDFHGWQTELEGASNVVNELGPITVSAYGEGYLVTALDVFASRVFLRYAETPFGPFARRVDAFDVLPTRGGFPGGGREHAGLRAEPRTLHVSYTTDDASAPGLHLVTFRVFGAFFR